MSVVNHQQKPVDTPDDVVKIERHKQQFDGHEVDKFEQFGSSPYALQQLFNFMLNN